MPTYETKLSKEALNNLEYWLKKNQKNYLKCLTLMVDIKEHPFTGIGKPEPLKFNYTGYWSRRIDKANRIIYKVEKDTIYVISCRFHYD